MHEYFYKTNTPWWHFDKKNGHYGFEDDNIGRVEFSSLEEMKTELSDGRQQVEASKFLVGGEAGSWQMN